MSDERAEAMMPTAAALVCAVADGDATDIAALLRDGIDWRALCVVLASLVPDDSPLTHPSPGPQAVIRGAASMAARAFNASTADVLGSSRYRNVSEARAVAMTVCRRAGLTSTHIGRAFGKDHTTVLYAASRVGENARLRRVANRIAEALGVEFNEEEVA